MLKGFVFITQQWVNCYGDPWAGSFPFSPYLYFVRVLPLPFCSEIWIPSKACFETRSIPVEYKLAATSPWTVNLKAGGNKNKNCFILLG